MARSKLIRTDRWAYHVTSRSNNREWFYIPTEECWTIFVHYLERMGDMYGTQTHLFVLMSNHFHLLLSTPRENLDEAMRYLLTEVARTIRTAAGRINHVFGTRYKWSVLDSAEGLAYAFKYVARNPVRAGLVERAADYRFSSLGQVLRGGSTPPVVEGIDRDWGLIPRGPEQILQWLDRPTSKESEALVGRALRRKNFKFTSDKTFASGLSELHAGYGVQFP